MPIITLTSDWGLRDHYLAAMKGDILRRLPSVTIVDITHDISPFNLKQASFIIRNSYPHFPAGTVHIISLLSESDEKAPYLLVEAGGQYFIGTDNGIFSLVFDHIPGLVIRLGDRATPEFRGLQARQVFAEAAMRLLNGEDPRQMGEAVTSWNEQLHFHPVVSGDVIRGVVTYINQYENVVTNISRELFDKVSQGRRYVIEFRGETLRELHAAYHDVPVGEIVALFGSTGHLEIAINQGNAASLLGLEINDPVRVEFRG